MARIGTLGLLMMPPVKPRVLSEKEIILDRHFRALKDEKKK